MHRLLLALTESIEQGFIALSAEAALGDTGHGLVTVTTTGTGLFAMDDDLAWVLQRHGVRGVDVARPDMRSGGGSHWPRSPPSTRR
jgi:hypothetical protein